MKTETIKIRITYAADRFKVLRASGVLVEQKSVRRTCSPFAPVGRLKEDILRQTKQINIWKIELARKKRKKADRQN